jgi:hypothetical protein
MHLNKYQRIFLCIRRFVIFSTNLDLPGVVQRGKNEGSHGCQVAAPGSVFEEPIFEPSRPAWANVVQNSRACTMCCVGGDITMQQVSSTSQFPSYGRFDDQGNTCIDVTLRDTLEGTVRGGTALSSLQPSTTHQRPLVLRATPLGRTGPRRKGEKS